jgi:diguanylate cyclase (GGDEF)-like protein/PAS domain S-box-containing protein
LEFNVNRDEHQNLSRFIDQLIDAICVVDKSGRFEFVSASAEQIFGYRPDEMIGMKVLDLVFPADRERTLAAAINIMQGHENTHFENRYVRKDGQIVDILWSARWSEAYQQRIAIARDITRRKNIERRQAALYAISEAAHMADDLPTFYQGIHHIIEQLLPAANFAIAAYDANTSELSFLYNTDTKTADTSVLYLDEPTQNPLISTSLRQLNSINLTTDQGDSNNSAFCRLVIHKAAPLLANFDSLSEHPVKIRNIVKRSQSSWLGVPLRLQQDIIGVLMMHSDINTTAYTQQDEELMGFVSTQVASAIERQQMLTKLKHIALYDQLTQLPNRALFHDRMQVALAHANREKTRLSLLFLDLDKFKWVNDNCGHQIGDALLQITAQRILHCVRKTDTVSRFGGDEFVILLDDVGSENNSLKIAQSILTALNQAFHIADQLLHIVPSIGIAHYPQHGLDEKQLLASSDAAMYRAKQSGGNRIQVCS